MTSVYTTRKHLEQNMKWNSILHESVSNIHLLSFVPTNMREVLGIDVFVNGPFATKACVASNWLVTNTIAARIGYCFMATAKTFWHNCVVFMLFVKNKTEKVSSGIESASVQ